MIIRKGEKCVSYSWQQDFPKTATCICGGEARIAFVAQEQTGEEFYIADLHVNLINNKWPHDAVAVAVYFCGKCLKSVAIMNQA